MNPISIIKEHPHIIKLFKVQYPDLEFENLDEQIITDIIESLCGETMNNILKKNNSQNNTIENTYDLAASNIPEMLIPIKLIYLSGKINKIPIKILFDTGATTNYIFKSKILEAGFENIIDKNNIIDMYGINSKNKTFGTIWYTEIELDILSPNNDKTTTMLGLNFSVVCDDNNKNSNSFDAIFGLTFMKFYKTNIDFATQTITLNNKFKLGFN
jgi:hypothetical protein